MQKNVAIITVGFLISLSLAGCGNMYPYFSMSQDSHYDRGQELIEDGELDAALEELVKAALIDPENADIYTTIGDVHRKNGDFKKASKNYRTACRTDPYSFRPHYNLGVTYQAMADLTRTLKKAQKFLRKAVQVYIRAVALKPDSFDAHLNLGACYFQLGKTKLATRQTIKALNIKSNSARANNNLAVMHETNKNFEEAIFFYKASLEANTKQPEVMMTLGSIYFRLGRIKSALATYRSAARIAPDLATLHEQIGVCLFRLKRFDAAFDAFQRAIQENPHSPGAYRGYGVICMYKYVFDNSKVDLKNRALWSWDFSLQLQPDQQDLVRLIERFGPVPPLPATENRLEAMKVTPPPVLAEPTLSNSTPLPQAEMIKKNTTPPAEERSSEKYQDVWKPNPKTAEVTLFTK